MKTPLIILSLAIILLNACARLDANLFEPESLSEYKLEEYQGSRELTVPAEFSIDADKISLLELKSGKIDETVTIAGLFVGDIDRISNNDYSVILYCHGNKKHIDYYWNRIKLLANVGGKNHYGVMTVDYRGYGLSDGEPSENGVYADVDAAMKWLKDQGLTEDRLTIYGYSLGSAPAVELSTNPRTLKPQKVILEAPFASATVMVQDSAILALPSSFVTNLNINNAERIKTMTQPLLWFHGTADDFISISSHGELVFSNHPGIENIDKFAERVQGAKHNNIPQVIADQQGGFQTYLDKVLTFLEN